MAPLRSAGKYFQKRRPPCCCFRQRGALLNPQPHVVYRDSIDYMSSPSLTKKTRRIMENISSNWSFALTILCDHPNEESIVFSPASLLLGLAMTHSGARGQSAEDLAAILSRESSQDYSESDVLTKGSSDFSDIQTHYQLFNSEISSLAVKEKTFGLHNKLFLPEKVEVIEDLALDRFRLDLIENYGIKLVDIDSSNNWLQEIAELNERVLKASQGEIKELVDSDSIKHDKTSLVNLSYFVGNWKSHFKTDHGKGPFYCMAEEDGHIAVPFISNEDRDEEFSENELFMMVTLEYRDSQVLFHILLPKRRDEFADAKRELTDEMIKGLIETRKRVKMKFRMPKFDVEHFLDVKGLLTDLGCDSIFDESLADFAGISEKNKLYIHEILHKTKLSVDMYGTLASSISVVEVGEGERLPVERPSAAVEFNADHPFLFAISFNLEPLFVGQITGDTFSKKRDCEAKSC